MKNYFDFTGKVGVITGGASGIGLAIASALLEQGASIAVLDRNKEALTDKWGEPRENLLALACDLTEESEVNKAIQKIRENFGTPNFLVNSVGLNVRKPVFELEDTELEAMYRINFFGVFRFCRRIAGLMVKEDIKPETEMRKIVNIASTGAHQASMNYAGYNSSKAALVNATRIMANEWYPRGISVNVLCPGPTMTPFIESYYRENPGLMENVIKKTPAGRLAVPEDHVGPVLFLLSGASDWIVGEALVSDGGKGLNG